MPPLDPVEPDHVPGHIFRDSHSRARFAEDVGCGLLIIFLVLVCVWAYLHDGQLPLPPR